MTTSSRTQPPSCGWLPSSTDAFLPMIQDGCQDSKSVVPALQPAWRRNTSGKARFVSVTDTILCPVHRPGLHPKATLSCKGSWEIECVFWATVYPADVFAKGGRESSGEAAGGCCWQGTACLARKVLWCDDWLGPFPIYFTFRVTILVRIAFLRLCYFVGIYFQMCDNLPG